MNQINRKPCQLKSGDLCSDEDELGMPSSGCEALLAGLADIPVS